MLDQRGRPMHDLRISVTDRCNFRCVYCMPREVFGPDFPYVPRSDLLTLEEIARVANVFVSLGVEKIRITGGEPLLRRNLERLIELLAATGVQDLALTTNGSLLTREKARILKNAGLTRITVSLDALEDAVFRSLCDTDLHVSRVLDATEFAERGTDLRALLRGGASDDDLREAITRVWRVRDDRYSEIRSEETRAAKRVEMSHIGG